jgi:hypothetical protein
MTTKEDLIRFVQERITQLNELSPIVYNLGIESNGYYLLEFKRNSEAKQWFYRMNTKDLNRIYVVIDHIIGHYRLLENN